MDVYKHSGWFRWKNWFGVANEKYLNALKLQTFSLQLVLKWSFLNQIDKSRSLDVRVYQRRWWFGLKNWFGGAEKKMLKRSAIKLMEQI